jgi:hypothetical protein
MLTSISTAVIVVVFVVVYLFVCLCVRWWWKVVFVFFLDVGGCGKKKVSRSRGFMLEGSVNDACEDGKRVHVNRPK